MDDRLSSLDDDVLAHILSFLDTRSAVRTSVLASRWKYLHTFTTGLNIDSSRIRLSSHICGVNRIVMQHKVNIKKFTVWTSFDYQKDGMDGSLLNSWISFALSRGVEELRFRIDAKYDDWAPASLFISQTLVVFNLSAGGSNLTIPSSVWLPNLKILHMSGIMRLVSSSMTMLFDGCPLLEDFSLDSCTWVNERQVYTIPAPMLRRLRITNCKDEYYINKLKIWFDVPRLKYIELVGPVKDFYCIKSSTALAIADITVDDDVSSDCMLSLIRGLSNAKTVKLVQIYYEDYGDYCSYNSHCLPDQFPIFGNLLELEVSLGPRESHSVLPEILQHLISKSPNLKTLVFREGFRYCYSHLLEIVVCQPSTWSSQVKVIQVEDFSGSTKEVEMLTFFATKAIGLKQLNVNVAVAEHHESNNYCHMNEADDHVSDEFGEYSD
ncbi:hypothetical protein Dimus_012528 [Dionaea muscipula]